MQKMREGMKSNSSKKTQINMHEKKLFCIIYFQGNANQNNNMLSTNNTEMDSNQKEKSNQCQCGYWGKNETSFTVDGNFNQFNLSENNMYSS